MNALASPDGCKDFMDAFLAALRDVVAPLEHRPKDYQKNCDFIYNYIDNRIDEAASRVAGMEKTTDLKPGSVRIIDELVKTSADKISLRYLILSIFSPSHDTVAVTVSNVFFHLARHPECWDKLKDEVMPTASQPLTYGLLNSFKYLNWVIRESE